MRPRAASVGERALRDKDRLLVEAQQKAEKAESRKGERFAAQVENKKESKAEKSARRIKNRPKSRQKTEVDDSGAQSG